MHSVVELFAGAGGMALGFEKAGFKTKGLFELDKWACATLQNNRPNWPVIQGDVSLVDFSEFDPVDVVAGGFPCQAFSHAGKQRGFSDTRGTLFYQLARATKELRPKVVVGENVSGLVKHDNGNTLKTIISTFEELGYLVSYKVLTATDFEVPQKRKRLIIVGLRRELFSTPFEFPAPAGTNPVLADALKKGSLYATDVPESAGMQYSAYKKSILDQVPPGGWWTSLPASVQKEYLGENFNAGGGGSTGMARRLSWNLPSLTLTTGPAQKMTERCHPDETRPLTVREYARIQTFPDEWQFAGGLTNQYKQIGNAVPVNLAYHIALAIQQHLNNKAKEALASGETGKKD